jgi:hypothetical protein
MAADVLNSPAVSLLCQLEADGFELAAVDNRLLVKPLEKLPDGVRQQLGVHRQELVTLIRICDEGAQARTHTFVEQLAGGLSVGRLMVRPNLRKEVH